MDTEQKPLTQESLDGSRPSNRELAVASKLILSSDISTQHELTSSSSAEALNPGTAEIGNNADAPSSGQLDNSSGPIEARTRDTCSDGQQLILTPSTPKGDTSLVESDQEPLTEFTWFPTLPAELRIKIWKLALPGPRVIDISKLYYKHVNRGLLPIPGHFWEDDEPGYDGGLYYWDGCSHPFNGPPTPNRNELECMISRTPPSLLHVCSESRHESLKVYELLKVSKVELAQNCFNVDSQFYIDYKKDIMYFNDFHISDIFVDNWMTKLSFEDAFQYQYYKPNRDDFDKVRNFTFHLSSECSHREARIHGGYYSPDAHPITHIKYPKTLTLVSDLDDERAWIEKCKAGSYNFNRRVPHLERWKANFACKSQPPAMRVMDYDGHGVFKPVTGHLKGKWTTTEEHSFPDCE